MKPVGDEKHEENGGTVARCCYPFLLFGSSHSQFALALLGLINLCVVFGNHPNTGFGLDGRFSLVPLVIVATGLLAGAIFEAGKSLKILHGGDIVSARLCKIKEDSTHDNMEYHLVFEYSEAGGQSKRIQAVRDMDDLVIGQIVFILINRELGVGILETNLPGGISFKNVYGMEPVTKECWIRLLFIPLLTIIPFLGFIGPVSTFIERVTFAMGLPILYWWTVISQLIWYCSNRRYFSPGKPIELDDNCCKP